jgi:hypothetical protein
MVQAYQHHERMDIADDVTFPLAGTMHPALRCCCLRISREQSSTKTIRDHKSGLFRPLFLSLRYLVWVA